MSLQNSPSTREPYHGKICRHDTRAHTGDDPGDNQLGYFFCGGLEDSADQGHQGTGQL